MKINYINYLMGLMIVSIMIGCGENSGNNDQEVPEEGSDIVISKAQFEGESMQLGTIARRNFPVLVKATGVIDVPPENKATITTFAEGYVKKTSLLEGDEVKKGQFLVSLENPEYVQIQQDYLEAKEQMDYLESEYKRQKSLYEENITSEKNYLKAQSEFRKNKAQYQAYKRKLEMLNIKISEVEAGNFTSLVNIYSPISGQVANVQINKGSFVPASKTLMQIIDKDHLHIELNVFERDLVKLEKDQPIHIMIPEASNDTIMARIYLIGSTIDPKTRTVRVHGHFDEEEDKKLAVGMFVDANIEVTEKDEPSLPEESFVELDENIFLLKLDSVNSQNYFFSRQAVEPGNIVKGFRTIKNDQEFDNEDQFLIKGAFQLIRQ